MAVHLAHRLERRYQPKCREVGGLSHNSWSRTIRAQSRQIESALEETPNLRPWLKAMKSRATAWRDAVICGVHEPPLVDLPEECSWDLEAVLRPDWEPPPRDELTHAHTR